MRHCLLLLSSLLLAACAPRPGTSDLSLPSLRANDNRMAAGTLQDGVLKLKLEVTEGDWQAEHALPTYRIFAFAEAGKDATVPGPLIRVPQGTLVDVAIHSRISKDLFIHGLHARPGSARPLLLQAHATVTTRFRADGSGTYYYWGSLGKPLDEREGHDSELIGALIVDATGSARDDRIFIITRHGTEGEGGDGVGAWTINGRSWPQTERLSYRVGEPVHWRWINASGHRHPMHLHGMYFRVTSSGDNAVDIRRAPGEQNDVVTQTMSAASTMSMSWVPLHAGNWLFHCHIMFHVMPENRIPEPLWYDDYAKLPHDEHMAGLVLGINVRSDAAADNGQSAPPPRRIEMRVAERPGVNFDEYYKRHVPGVGYAIDDSPVSAPGPALVLERGRPVEITIHNALANATSVHWHGIEVESSYYDGVPHWGVDGDRVTPWIDPGGSFVARFTPPRAGTFMYHTHFNDYAQLTAGLYGALLVVEPGQPRDAAIDHVYVIGQGPDEEKDPILLNGVGELPTARWRIGSQQRVRLVGITGVQTVRVRLLRNGQTVTWRALAKDGADLPAALATLRAAEVDISPGETWDFAYAADERGTLRLEAAVPKSKTPVASASIAVE
ncbi:MAG TPA: multicopper oxidase domain-containing protein [Rudaea sp.]|nr:multicopper oxidase domain-containing protein [Rudaea sp.]